MSRYSVVTTLALACVVATNASAQNIVTNPGFETGTFSGWTVFGDPALSAVDGHVVHSGSFAGGFGPIAGLGGIYQTLNTEIGYTYTFSWWLENDGGMPSTFDAWWNGSSVFSLSNPDGFGYTHHSFSVLATSESTDIRFFFLQVPEYFNLDDVVVETTDGHVEGTPLAVTPEPATMTLLATGLVAMAGASRRRRKASAK